MASYRFELVYYNFENTLQRIDVSFNDLIIINENQEYILKIHDKETNTFIKSKKIKSKKRIIKTVKELFFDNSKSEFQWSDFNIDYLKEWANNLKPVFIDPQKHEFNQINNIKPKNMTDEKLQKGLQLQHEITQLKTSLEALKEKTRTKIETVKIETDLGQFSILSSRSTCSLRSSHVEFSEEDSNKIKTVLIQIHEDKIKKLEKEYKAL